MAKLEIEINIEIVDEEVTNLRILEFLGLDTPTKIYDFSW